MPPPTDDLKQNLLHALSDEIGHIKKVGGSNSYTIRNGERIGRVSGRSVYRFDFDGERLETDVPVQVLVGDSKERIEAEIVSVVGQEITLATQAALPENVPKAKMFADPLFILERLRDHIASPPEGFNVTLSRKLFGKQGSSNASANRSPSNMQQSSGMGQLNKTCYLFSPLHLMP